MDEERRCDLCGKVISDHGRARDRCQAGLGQDESMAFDCKDRPLFSCLTPGGAGDFVREAMRAPLLRSALREALQIADLANGSAGGFSPDREARIAELRAKFLGDKNA